MARKIISAFFLIGGTLVCLWVLQKIYAVMDDPLNVATLRQMIPLDPESLTMDVDGKKVLMPGSLFNIAGYGIVLGYLLGAGIIGGIFIKAGLKVYPKRSERIEKKLDELLKNLDQAK